MNLNFTTVLPSEQSKVLELFKTAAQRIATMNIDHWQYWHDPPPEKIQWVTQGITNAEYFFIHNDQQELIGMVRILNEDLLYWGKQEENATYIHSLLVTDAFNGRGMGKKIIASICAKASNKGSRFLRLDADSKNPKLCRYYEGLGFKKVGQVELPLSVYHLYEKEL